MHEIPEEARKLLKKLTHCRKLQLWCTVGSACPFLQLTVLQSQLSSSMLSSVEHWVKLSGAPNPSSHPSCAPFKKQRQVVRISERRKNFSLAGGQLSRLRLPLPFRHAGGSPMAMASTAMPQSTNTLSSWESLSEKCSDGIEEAERLPNTKTRVFEGGQEPKLVFYRDNSSWCPYCERVWMQLEEKRIPYSVEKINMRCYGDKPAWFTKMVPSGLLPVLQIDGRVVTESMDIMFLIERKFPEHNPLLPAEGSREMKAVEPLLRLERALAGAWLSRLRSSWPDMNGFENAMDKVNSALKEFGGPYFLGSKFSMVDAVYAPFLERIAASIPYWQGVIVRGNDRWPAVNAWFDAMDSRPTYQAMKSDDFTITHTLEPQIGPCRPAAAGKAYRDKINGKDGGWDLPLKPEVTAWGFDDGTGKGGAKLQAANTLIRNHDKVVGFALRGVTGDREMYRNDVDVAFNCVANALLVGVENVAEPITQDTFPPQVAVAAAYLRDRVGIPRDLTYPAARQLRAHLNWLVRSLGSDL